MQVEHIFEKYRCEAVWIDSDKHVNRYVDFIHRFQIPHPCFHARLYVSVDTEYVLYINGSYVDCDQYDDYPEHKAYDILDVAQYLQTGENRLCIRAYHQGEDSLQYVTGTPMLCYVLDAGGVTVLSGSDALCRPSPAYRQGPMDKLTMQLGFSFHYDARLEDDWTAPGYIPDAHWRPAVVKPDVLNGISFYPRPVRKQELKEPVKTKLVSQGVYQAVDRGSKPLAWRMRRDFLSYRDNGELFEDWTWVASGHQRRPARFPGQLKLRQGIDNVYLTLDMGAEETGLFHLKLNAGEGTLIEACYGEHLQDMRVRCSFGDENFAFSYVCREGEQEFTHYFRRLGGRYIQLQISGIQKPLSIQYAGVIPMVYPVEYTGSFISSDKLTNRIMQICDRTLQLCMHEHYEDSPWREQALYGMDSRNQMLPGYYMYDNGDFALANLLLLAEHPRPDGLLQNSSPSEYPISMPSFSLEWVLSVRDFVLYTGRIADAEPLFSAAEKVIDAIGSYYDGYLLKTPFDPDVWNFYEWTEGLQDPDGFSQNPTHTHQYDAPLNALFAMAVRAMTELAGWMGRSADTYTRWYERIHAHFFETFFVPEENKLASFIDKGEKVHYAELTHAWALLGGLVPEEYAPILRDQLLNRDGALEKSIISFCIFRYEALLEEPERFAEAVFDEIADRWGYMLFNGATSFWETLSGADDFYGLGSLCHGWTGMPAYFYYAYQLGVRPTSPGFATYRVAPVLPDVNLEGTVCTPCGRISVRLHNGVCKESHTL